MHESSYQIVKAFADRFVTPELQRLQRPLDVADVGSYDVNGTYKPIFGAELYRYEGLDIVPGPNVDRIVPHYDFGEALYDVLISGSCMEHVEDIFAWANALMRAARPGALICVTAPHTWVEHRHPVDCWRIFPDGMRFAFRALEILECSRNNSETWLYARKP